MFFHRVVKTMAGNVHAKCFCPLVTCSAFIVGLSSSPSKSDPFSMDPFQSTFPSSKVSLSMYEYFGKISSVYTPRGFRFAVSSFLMRSRFRSRNDEVLLIRLQGSLCHE